MRCTKCGYISFDNLQNCGKCSTDLQEVSSLLNGTAVRAEPFFFLSNLLEQSPEPAPFAEEEEELLLDEDQGEEAAETLDLKEEEGEEAAETLDLGEEESVAEEAATEDLESSLAVEDEEKQETDEMPAVALEAEEGRQTDEMPAVALEAEETAAPETGEEAEGLELSLEAGEEEETPAAVTAAEEEQAMPEGLELKDIAAPGENVTASLEEIDLKDLMGPEDEEGEAEVTSLEEGLSLEEKIDDEEVEKIFDLSDVMEEEGDGDDGEQEAAAADEGNRESAAEKKEGEVIGDLDLDLDLDDE